MMYLGIIITILALAALNCWFVLSIHYYIQYVKRQQELSATHIRQITDENETLATENDQMRDQLRSYLSRELSWMQERKVLLGRIKILFDDNELTDPRKLTTVFRPK